MKLVIEPFRLILQGANDRLMKFLRSKLAIYDNYCKWPKILWTAILERSDGSFLIPRFIPRKFIFSRDVEIVRKDDNYEEAYIRIKMDASPKNDLQKDALNYLFDDMNNFRDNVRVLDLPTGSGKTFLALAAISRLGVKACIFVHKITMIETPWIKDILQFTDIKREEICVIQGSDSIKRALKKKDQYKIFICVHKTFETIAQRADGEEIIRSLYTNLGIGMNIIDEAHRELLDVFYINMFSPCKRSLYLTATLGRVDYKENEIFRYIVPVRDTFRSNVYIEDNKIITYCPRSFTTNINEHWIKSFHNDVGVRLSKYCDYIMANEDVRLKLYEGITNAIDEIMKVNPDAQVTVLLGTLELIQWIYDGLVIQYPDYTIGNFTSLIPAKHRIDELKKKIILSTEKSMDSATDSSVDNLILTVPVTNDIQLTQIIGRIREKENHPAPYFVYDIFDVSVPKTLKNFNTRKKVISEKLAKEVKKA